MKKTKNIAESFYHAGQGLIHCIKYERNIRIHLLMAVIALILGLVLKINHYEFLVLFLLIAVVIVSEMINTAIENVVDMITEDFHPLAKVVKDITAGAVMFSCLVAVCIGLIIFVPHILELFK
ncbi:MAG: diacylglycerol kinase family protein [Bacillota bacterium]|nr:diacylglycerol kinase family protein [Bacillota bacterium]